jgi:N-methylhydantoinase A
MASFRIGIDIGGTFTDITVLNDDTGEVTIAKVASRRGDPGGALIDAIERGLEHAGADRNEVSMLVHGTTLVTNAVLENALPRAALLTTEGFRDVLEIGRHFRPDMYDLQQDKPEPVIPRDRRFGILERVSAEGEILKEPEDKDILKVVEAIRRSEVEAVAVCLLNSYVNPANEAKIRNRLQQELPDLAISASYDVCREVREFERMSTVSLNAAAVPLVSKYLEEIGPRVRSVLPKAKILLMQSSGGSLTVSAARAYPARMITSGPAGGALAVQRLGKATGYPHLLGVDMGGTSTDISFIHKGEVRMTTEGTIAGRPVMLPMIEINTIGAGAGSVAWLDGANGLHVGPRSAGSDPGPVAYLKGGAEPTVTDANLVLGRLHPTRFASGTIKLDVAAARAAFAERVGKPLGLSVEEAAAGVIHIANANMERAVRVSSAQKGYDPRDIMLVAFGGAGPMHAAELAKAVGIPTVLVPEQPGVFSALGLVMADIRHDTVQTRIARGAGITPEHLQPLFAELEELANSALEQDGVPPAHRAVKRTADLRYEGQAYEVNVPVPGGTLDKAAIEATLKHFHELHQQLYAHSNPERAVEFVSGRASAVGLTSAPEMRKKNAGSGPPAPKERRSVYFDSARGFEDTAVYDRVALNPGCALDGPMIVEQIDTTVVVLPGQKISVDDFGNLLILTGAGK